MLHVLQVIPTLDRSGAEKQMMLLACGLPRDRFRVEVAALTRLGPLEVDLRAAGVPVTLIGKRHKIDPVGYRRLEAFVRDGRFDVVQTWIFAGNAYGRLAAHRAGVPVILATEMAVDLWKGRLERVVDRWLARWTDRVVGNSEAVVQYYRDLGIPEAKLARIYSGIGPEEPTEVDPAQVRREFGLEATTRLVLFAGRLAPQKGVDVLLRSLDLLQHVEPGVVTLIAGDGPLRTTLEEQARSFGLLGGAVRFLGHREDVPRLLAAADLLVLPSRYEGLPNVVLEAMRFAKPVVATAAPGTRELVVDGETGLLVPIDDVGAHTEAIRRLVRDPELAMRMGRAGRERVGRCFGLETMIDQFAALYEDLARS